MATCYNRNTPQYKALETKYKNKLTVDGFIDTYQRVTQSDEIPTVADVENIIARRKTMMSLKKKNYKKSILANLSRKNIIHNIYGEYRVNHSNPATRAFSPAVLKTNYNKVLKLLQFNNIPLEAVTFRKISNNVDRSNPTYFETFIVDINEKNLENLDEIKETVDKNKTHIVDIISQLQRTFPTVNVDAVTVAEAKVYYNNLPSEHKAKVPFDQINSYVQDGNVKLIQGRVTSEIAIEEMLHPFVAAAKQDNPTLYNNLLNEAKEMFPLLKQEIDNVYTDGRGFTPIDRDIELLTQSLARHFKQEYEQNPTQNWRSKLADLLKWFLNLVQQVADYVVGDQLRLNVNDIKPNSKLTDIAQLLNTEDLQILFNPKIDSQVRYSLDPNTKKVLDYVRGKSNDVQKMIIDNFFNVVENSKFDINGLSTDNVILDRKNHKYINLSDSDITYKSVTTAIKGELTDTEGLYELNRLLGNDFDTLLESITMNIPFEEMPKLNVLDEKTARDAYVALENYTFGLEADGSVLIPQVIVSDKESGIAGMIDLLRIHPDGTLTIIDLKSSKNSSKSFGYTDVVYPVSEGSVFYDPKDPNKKVFTTSQQHAIQTNLYKRILENKGYEVHEESQTFHVMVGIEGKGKDQKFTGYFKLDGTRFHPSSESKRYVDQIVPYRVNQTSENTLDSALEAAGIFEPNKVLNEQPQEQEPQDDAPTDAAYSAMFDAVNTFKKEAITRKKAIESLRRSTLFNMSQSQYIEELEQTISAINVAMLRGTVDIVFTDMLQDAIKKIDDVVAYLGDKNNFNDPEYIKHVLYWKKFVETYRGLANISDADGLNKTQLILKEKLQTRLNDLVGPDQNDRGDKEPGILDNALENYVVSWAFEKTNRNDLTEDDVRAMIKHTEDIGMIGHLTGDADTSQDILLALMAKEFKAKKQELLDKIQNRNEEIRAAATRLLKLSPGNTIDYSFMQVFDEGEWTGRYVKEIGFQYYSKLNELYDKLSDSEGNALRYIERLNGDELTDAEKEHNIKLAKAKEAFSEFMRPEELTREGRKDGKYHRLTKEFLDARNRVMEYKPSIRQYVRKNGVSDIEVQNFKNKYYDEITYYRKIKNSNGEFTGLVKLDTMNVIKKDYVEKREVTSDGQEMRDSKYLKIMNPQNELERAQKDFYLMFRRIYEDELLPMLPKNIEMLMSGKSPIVRDRFMRELEKKPDIVKRLWGKMGEGWTNFWNTTTKQEVVAFDEYGNFVEDTLPIYYIGNPKTEEDLTEINNKIQLKIKQIKTAKNAREEESLKEELKRLRLERNRLQNAPTTKQMSRDMADNLLRFGAMAQNYESLGQIEDTLKAVMHTMEKRTYEPAEFKVVSKLKEGFKRVGLKGTGSTRGEARLLQRARKWMSMTYYDNEKRSLEWYDKLSQKVVSFSSLGYVGFNVFGNINNFVMGRVNNGIEAIGGLYFDRSAYVKATAEFNKRMGFDYFNKWAHNYYGAFGTGKYEEYKPYSKFEASVDYFRMLDDKTDIRETTKTPGVEGRASRMLNSVAYSLNDAFEYNVQTKIGLSILYSLEVDNGKQEGEGGRKVISLYDALKYDATTGKMSMKDGYTHVTLKSGKRKKWNDKVRFEIRNYIREVNKEVHGNYAREDRMVIQAHTIGMLAAQFHKWIAPAVRARFRTEYFDENLGWKEGRYRSMLNFLAYAARNLQSIGKLQANYKEYHGDKGKMKLGNVHRTLGELMIFMSVYMLNSLLANWDEDDDDSMKSATRKRFENAFMYQANRLQKEMLLYVPVFGGREQIQILESPISSTRIAGEFSEAMLETMRWIPNLPAYLGQEDGTYEFEQWKKDSGLYYTRGSRKGKAKLGKEWGDFIPLVYTINRWLAFDNIKNFYIK